MACRRGGTTTRMKIHAAPAKPLSSNPPTMAVLPSAERETEEPCCAAPTAPDPIRRSPCCDQIPPLLVQTQVAPSPPLPPTNAVSPSAARETELPTSASPTLPDAVSLPDCWSQIPAFRVQPQTAPVLLVSVSPPMIAVSPVAERATDHPCHELPTPETAPRPTSLGPCCVQTPPLRVQTQAAPWAALSP